jgi:DNA-binding response OmpR family regulator
MSEKLILLVDDEPHIIELEKMYLEREGFRTISAGNGVAAMEAVALQKPALMVLDIMLPELSGLEVCKKLREEDNPIAIIMVTARDDDIDKILGLELGADDYLTKPFNPRELVARVKAILRRESRIHQTELTPIQIEDLEINPASRNVYINGERIELRAQEFDLLLVFIQNKGIVLTREQLLEQAWGYDYFGQTRTVDVHVGHLRKKLATSKVKIETVTGVGYKLVP